MRFIAVLALVASALAVPAELGTQELCIGLNNEWCSNSTTDYKCCTPLVCGSDSRCHRPY